MKNFRWLLNWAVEGIHINDNVALPVWKGGVYVGTCTITLNGNNIIGEFNLDEELDDEHYLLYTVSVPELDPAGHQWLVGLTIVPPYNGVEKSARTVKEMHENKSV